MKSTYNLTGFALNFCKKSYITYLLTSLIGCGRQAKFGEGIE